MDEAGTQRIAWKLALYVREQRVDERAGLRAVPRMRNHSGRLVDDENVRVFVDDVEFDCLGRRDQFVSRRNLEHQYVARFEQPARFRGCAVDQDAATPSAARDQGA